jgi:hypothetical protein
LSFFLQISPPITVHVSTSSSGRLRSPWGWHDSVETCRSAIMLFVCFPGVTTHCGCIFHSRVASFSLLLFEISWSHTTARHSR